MFLWRTPADSTPPFADRFRQSAGVVAHCARPLSMCRSNCARRTSPRISHHEFGNILTREPHWENEKDLLAKQTATWPEGVFCQEILDVPVNVFSGQSPPPCTYTLLSWRMKYVESVVFMISPKSESTIESYILMTIPIVRAWPLALTALKLFQRLLDNKSSPWLPQVSEIDEEPLGSDPIAPPRPL